ncbi:uncharacterized protein QC763_700005 [Podospora pseudopauciseta]|uniref:Uncharacterized protein n=1 Tax=Podospora pseudopauciseta TaxID=2093780 RepID=A0ABR0H3A9_9PEZI|nr:hypothetical protein QC763_700005 [Podospora pseudopauciseta]
MVSTLTQSCDCRMSIPTVTANFPCEDNCKGLHCTTSYNIVTPSTCATINPPVDQHLGRPRGCWVGQGSKYLRLTVSS